MPVCRLLGGICNSGASFKSHDGEGVYYTLRMVWKGLWCQVQGGYEALCTPLAVICNFHFLLLCPSTKFHVGMRFARELPPALETFRRETKVAGREARVKAATHIAARGQKEGEKGQGRRGGCLA